MDKKLVFPKDFKGAHNTSVYTSTDKTLKIKPIKTGIWSVFYLDTTASKPIYLEARFKRGFSRGDSPTDALAAYYQFKRSGLAVASTPKVITVALSDIVTETHSVNPVVNLDESYVPPMEDPTVHKVIEILNQLCKKYKYCVLKNHEVVDENSLVFSLAYYFNGKEVGDLSFELDKQTSGKWLSRCYLSVKRAAKLPMTNISMLISDFKRIVATNLHLAVL